MANLLTINIITTIAEVLLVFIFFFLINWCFRRLYRQLFKISFLEKFNNNASVIRRKVRNFIFFLSFILSLAIIGVNGYLIYRGENVREYSLQLFLRIPQEFWIALGLGIAKSIGVIIGLSITLRIFNPLLDKLSQYVQDFDEITDNDRSIATFFNALKKNINSASWIAIAILCAQFLILPPIVSKYLFISLRIYLIVAIGRLLFKVVAVIIDSLDALSVKNSSPDNLLRFYEQLRHLISFLKRCLEYITYVFMATLAIQQIDFIANLAVWGEIGIKLISILLISRIVISVIYLTVEEILLKSDNLTDTQLQRRQTITPLIQSCSKYLIYFGAGILMLDTIGVDPGPILAGAGILGLAVGLGAQNLINDIVSGFFILFENYYLVGDYIETDEASGYVEAIELRTTRIRHQLGQVYIIRNGDINSITNYSKDFVYAYVEVGVDYGTNLVFTQEIIEKVGRQLKEENDDILEPTQVDGIKEFGDIRLSIFTVTKVKPGRHIQVKRILRQSLKDAFDREGIYIPLGEASDKPEWVSKIQQEQNKKYRNRKPKFRHVVHRPENAPQITPAQNKQYPQKQLNGKPPIDKFPEEIAVSPELTPKPTNSRLKERPTLDKSVEETAEIIKETSQAKISQLEAEILRSEKTESTATSSSPALAQSVEETAQDISKASQAEIPQSESKILQPEKTESATTSSSPALTQSVEETAQDISKASQAEIPQSESKILQPEETESATTSSSPALTQSVEETARNLSKASQAIIPQSESKVLHPEKTEPATTSSSPALAQSVKETAQNILKASRAIILQPKSKVWQPKKTEPGTTSSSSALEEEEFAQKTQIQQDQGTKDPKDRRRKSKNLKNMLQEFLDSH